MEDDVDQHPHDLIVVGVDGSDASKDALRWAARQAKVTGASLRAVMTWQVPVGTYAAPMALPGGYDFGPEAERTLDESIREVLGEHPGVEVSAVVIEGHPAPKLLEAAADATLLVVGSRGHGAFTGMLLGSVSEHCVAHAPCPVVVVRHSPDPA